MHYPYVQTYVCLSWGMDMWCVNTSGYNYVCTYIRMCMYIRMYITDCIALHPSDLLLKLTTTVFV